MKLKESPPGEEANAEGRVSPRIVAGADGLPELAAGTKLPRSYQIVMGGSDGLRYQLWARHESMQQLADRLSSQLGRPVIDKTQLTSVYDFALTWVVEGAGGNIPRTDPPPDEIDSNLGRAVAGSGVDILSAVQSQLGLRLRADKGPITMLVVDRAERIPIGN